MIILRTVGNYELNEGNGMAKGLFNISNTENNNELSLWFDQETKNELLELSDKDFENMAKDFCNQ